LLVGNDVLVGNDIVDLGDPENQPGAIHPRFDERVFTPAEWERLAERARLTGQAAAHRLRWRMWAAKESAFKAARKLDAGVRFLPRRFSVQLPDNARAVIRHAAVGHAVVRHAVGRFEVSFHEAEDWVHAIATLSGGIGRGQKTFAVIERVERGRSAASDASARVRAMARSALGSVLSIAPCEIEIAAAGCVPVARWRKSPLPVNLSLSHHGSFLACAWTSLRR